MTNSSRKRELSLDLYAEPRGLCFKSIFKIQTDGQDFIRFGGGTKNIRSLQSMLSPDSEEERPCCEWETHGSWILTTKGVKDAEHWMKVCDQIKRVKLSLAGKNDSKDQTSLEEEKLAMVEAERDGLRAKITMADYTNECTWMSRTACSEKRRTPSSRRRLR